jgi:hypothetical protein
MPGFAALADGEVGDSQGSDGVGLPPAERGEQDQPEQRGAAQDGFRGAWTSALPSSASTRLLRQPSSGMTSSEESVSPMPAGECSGARWWPGR